MVSHNSTELLIKQEKEEEGEEEGDEFKVIKNCRLFFSDAGRLVVCHSIDIVVSLNSIRVFQTTHQRIDSINDLTRKPKERKRQRLVHLIIACRHNQ